MASEIHTRYTLKMDNKNNNLLSICDDIEKNLIRDNDVRISALILTDGFIYRTKSFIDTDFIYYLLSSIYNYSKSNKLEMLDITCDLNDEENFLYNSKHNYKAGFFNLEYTEKKSLVVLIQLQSKSYFMIQNSISDDFDKIINKIDSIVY